MKWPEMDPSGNNAIDATPSITFPLCCSPSTLLPSISPFSATRIYNKFRTQKVDLKIGKKKEEKNTRKYTHLV